MKEATVSQIVFEAAHMHAINFQSFLCPPFCARASPRSRTLRAHTMESNKKWRQSDDPPPSSGLEPRAERRTRTDVVMIYVANL